MLAQLSKFRRVSAHDGEHRWTGEFVDQSLETFFMAATWSDMRRQMRSVVLASLVFAAWCAVDFHYLGWTPEFALAAAGRWAVFGIACLLFRYFPDPDRSGAFFAAITIAEIFTALIFLSLATSGNMAYADNALAALIIIFTFFFVVPNRLLFNALAALFITVGSLFILRYYPEVTAISVARILLILGIANIVGLQAVRSSNLFRRREFLRLLHEQELNEQLTREMAERQEAQDSVRESDENFLSIFVSAPLALALVEPGTFKIIKANKAACELFGITEKEAVGLDGRSFFADYEVRRKQNRDQMFRVREGRAETRMRTRDGRIIWAQISQAMVQFQGKPTFLYGSQDMTLRHEEALALRAARDEATTASRSKSEFLANMSHELRTPLNAIIGFSEALEREIFGPVGNPRYREYAEDIHDSGVHLLNLINDILDLSKIEAGQFKLYEDETDLGEVINSACRIVRHRAMQSSISLQTRLDESEIRLVADERALKQVLINLLSNAVKFSPPESAVYIHASVRTHGVRIAVIDQGIGIAEEDIPRALTPFTQIDGTLTRAHEGTGLGLPLAKHLVELHGGSLSIVSQTGAGTTIYVDLPASRLVERQKNTA